ncbi:putative membrane protein [Wickerhamomyces ciferrii]|uniref:Membrane protein n=1 Tax=Wickerhamomyces ciferrii (strain ATCC 14091 / BCRC 22168 / CBS 111 / JCM 3599 / NBRC 0793 / NRRL Y-1031 F-60-10) TaxID=1206466 RepID=K0KIC4_WICCF|nr:uncharacterized protein BN7_1461 [Wickerhamomyces ciferrii]CCH41922.1 putative membrane protein [Wickerhamomyces ciferrii]
MVTFRGIVNKIKIKDSDTVKTDNWKSPDVICLPPSRRTWGHVDFLGFWNLMSLSITSWQSCSSLLALGLNVWQSMICIILAKFLIFGIALSHGWGGAVWHVGYPVYGRYTFGMLGSFLALIQRIVLCCVWYSVQSFTCAQLISTLLSSIFPTFNRLPNHFPDSLPMTTKQFTGFVIFHVVSIPFLYIKPEKLNKPFKFFTIISFFTIFGVAIGAMVQAHGGGDLLHSSSTAKPGAELGMSFMHGINVVINAFAVGLANQPDFSRFARKPGKQIWGQAFAILILGTIVPLFGVLGTSASAKTYGDVAELGLWNPPNIIEQWLGHYNARSRCAAFFASLGFFIATLGLNVIDNGVSGGIDLVAIAPKWINIRRGAYIIMIISIVIQPWQIIAKASVFTNVLGSYGCFFGPMIGVFTADYYFVRKQKLKLSDLYRAEKDSIYWFWHGFNWRAYVSWICGFVPGIVGFPSVNPALEGKVPTGAIKIFYISFIVGYAIAFIVHVIINYFAPPPGIGEIDEYDIYHTFTRSEAEKLGVIPHEDTDEDLTESSILPNDSTEKHNIQSVSNKLFKFS